MTSLQGISTAARGVAIKPGPRSARLSATRTAIQSHRPRGHHVHPRVPEPRSKQAPWLLHASTEEAPVLRGEVIQVIDYLAEGDDMEVRGAGGEAEMGAALEQVEVVEEAVTSAAMPMFTINLEEVAVVVDEAREIAIDDGVAFTPADSRWLEVKEVVLLALPALGAVLADPVMSLVDTSCVGQVNTVQLAALAPNSAIFNFIFQVFSFLGVATTNYLASNSIAAPGISDEERTHRLESNEATLAQTLVVAIASGAFITGFVFAEGEPLLRALGTSPAMMAPALAYLHIRGLSAPAVLFNIVSQGASMGQQDAWSPLKIFAFSGMFNLVFDVALILHWDFGVEGAAWATTAAQYVGAFAFWQLLKWRGESGNGIRLRWMGLPTKETLARLTDVGKPLVARGTALQASYSMMAGAAARIGTVPLAAHQVVMQVFWLFAYFPEPLSMAGQSLLARDITDRRRVHKLSRLLLNMSGFAGVLIAVLTGLTLALEPGLFSSNVEVQDMVRALTPQCCAAVFLAAAVVTLDGMAIGTNDYKHLPVSSIAGTVTVAAVLAYTVATGDIDNPTEAISDVWDSTLLFFVARLAVHAYHHISTGDKSSLSPNYEASKLD